MNIFKEIINLCKDYSQKEKAMAKAYEEITEKVENGTTLADQIIDVLKENKILKEQLEQAKKIIKTLADDLSMYSGDYQKELLEAKEFLKED